MNGVGEMIADLYSWIRGVACRVAMSESDGEDLAHDTIVKALLNRHRYDPAKDIKPWLMAIMLNTYKSRARHRQCLDICPLQEDWAMPERQSAPERYELRSLLAFIRGMADRDERMRPLWLYAEGYTYGEIAAKTKTDTGTVKSRIHYSRKRLRKLLNA